MSANDAAADTELACTGREVSVLLHPDKIRHNAATNVNNKDIHFFIFYKSPP